LEVGEKVAPAFLFPVIGVWSTPLAGRWSEVEAELEARVSALGFELVQASWAGSRARPVLRLRIDRADGEPVTVNDCAAVSRGLEPWLDAHEALPERYVLEVSSPGIERPLTRPRDWTRFAGRPVVVKAARPLAGDRTRVEGEIVGLDEDAPRPTARVRLGEGEEVRVPLEDVLDAHLVMEWD